MVCFLSCLPLLTSTDKLSIGDGQINYEGKYMYSSLLISPLSMYPCISEFVKVQYPFRNSGQSAQYTSHR
jgi:hypothetical protein